MGKRLLQQVWHRGGSNTKPFVHCESAALGNAMVSVLAGVAQPMGLLPAAAQPKKAVPEWLRAEMLSRGISLNAAGGAHALLLSAHNSCITDCMAGVSTCNFNMILFETKPFVQGHPRLCCQGSQGSHRAVCTPPKSVATLEGVLLAGCCDSPLQAR